MKFIVLLLFLNIAFAQEVYVTVKGDNIMTIIEKNLPVDLTDVERDEAKKAIQRNNIHIRDWYRIRPGSQVDLSNLDFSVKEVIYVEDNPNLYLDQAIYKIGLMWGIHSMTYLEKYPDFEVQSDSLSFLNYGINFLYSYGKNKKYWRFQVGYEQSSFSFYDETITWARIYKERKHRNYFFFLEFNKLKQSFTTLNQSQIKINKLRYYNFLNLGFQLDYYFLDNPSYFFIELGGLISGDGDNIAGANGVAINLGNSYGLTKKSSIKPFLKFVTLFQDTDSAFLTVGLDFTYTFDVL